jgi:hypothetical protein
LYLLILFQWFFDAFIWFLAYAPRP